MDLKVTRQPSGRPRNPERCKRTISTFQNNNKSTFQISKIPKKGMREKSLESRTINTIPTDKSNKHNLLLRWLGMHPAGHEIQNDAGAHLNITKFKNI